MGLNLMTSKTKLIHQSNWFHYWCLENYWEKKIKTTSKYQRISWEKYNWNKCLFFCCSWFNHFWCGNFYFILDVTFQTVACTGFCLWEWSLAQWTIGKGLTFQFLFQDTFLIRPSNPKTVNVQAGPVVRH